MIKSVIGLGFGDEGKGLVTNYLTLKSKNKPLIIRHSGGHQAGHNVVFNGTNHIFSNFGSGSPNGADTYWSKYCTVDPVGIINELKELKSKGIDPVLYIDADAPITTPYEKYHNVSSTNNLNHGTCGVGFGSTFAREENFYSLTFSDIFYSWIFEEKMNNISNYYTFNIDDDVMDEFILSISDIIKYKNNIKLTYGRPMGYDDIIFEGSQGLLLDQHYGFFPHVTRSNTGTKNIYNIISNKNIEFYLVTRAYQTRHGNGPMTNTNYDIEINNINETNVSGGYQGEFKKSILDVSLLEYGINKDKGLREGNNKKLVITCLDHLTEYVFTYNGDMILCDNEKSFIEKISSILKITVLVSKSNKSEEIKKY